MNKKLVITILTLFLVSPVLADPIEITEFDLPDSAEEGETITAEVRAEVDNKEVYTLGLDWGEGSEEKWCLEPGFCEREWEFTIDSTGWQSVEATAEDEDGLDTSRTEYIDISGQDSRVTTMTFSEMPDPAEVGETYTVSAEAYDSRGNLWNRDLDLYYEYYKNGFQQEEIGLNDCYWNPGLGTERERCSVEGDFEPVQGAIANSIVAEIETSDGELISGSESFNIEDPVSDDPAFFDVEIDNFDEEVEEGDTVEVDYTVTNTGDNRGSQYVNLNARGERNDRDYVSFLEPDESESGTLEWDTEEGDSGYRTIRVSSDDDEETETVNIRERDRGDPAFFDVREISFDSPAYVDDRVEVDYKIRNTGDSSARKTVTLAFRGSTEDSESVRLDSGEEREGNLDFRPGESDTGFRRLTISTNDDEKTEFIDIRQRDDPDDPAFFEMEIDDFDEKVTEGDIVNVDYTVTNSGDQSDTQNIELTARDRIQDRDFSIGLEPGESESGTLKWDTEEGDSGYRSIKVQSENDDATEIVEVLKGEDEPEDSEFRITHLDSNSPVDEGDTALIEYEVKNRGASDSQYVELYVRGERRDRDWVSLDSEESETGALRWQTEDGDSGYRRADVETENDEDFTYINVRESDEPVEDPDVGLTSVSASRYSVGPGESTTLRSRVENNRDQSSFVQVSWRADNLDLGSSTQNIPRNTERTLERERSYSQLINRGLESGECYSLSGRLRFSGDLIDSRDATQSLCLEEDDDDIDPDPESYDLDVIVLSSSGSPLADAEVSAGSQTAFTRSNGVATIEGLEHGSYDVTASKPGYSTRVRNNVQMDRDRIISLTLDEVDGVEADFSFSPDRPLEGQSVSFNGGLSSGNIVSYEWSFDDGSTASGRTVTHTLDEPGFYRVNLEVEDSQGRTDDRTRVVQVRSDVDDPEFFDLDVEVVDSETGDEIRDARVSVDGRTRTTDSRGRVNFNLEESVYSVFVSADNYRSSSRAVTLNRDRDIQVELDPREDTVDRGNIRINDVRMPASVCRGDDVTARLDLENTGDRDRAFTLSASGLSNQIDRSYSLEDGESFTRTVEFINVEGSGNERVSFSTGDDSRERTVQVRDCPETEDGDISISARPTQIRIGESVRVSGYVDNVRRGTQVTIGSDNRYRSLGSTTTDPDGRYELYVEPSKIGEQTLTAEASGREASTRIDVLPTVSVISASSRPDRVFEGDTYEVCAEIESQSSGPLVVLKEDGEEVASKYGRGEVCFDRRSSPGNYDYEVVGYARGQRSSKSTSVEVMEMDSEVRNFPDQIASVRSGSGMVRVQLYNNKREFRNYEISLEGLPRSWTSQSRKEVHLDSGERKTEYLYFTPKEEGQFTGTLRIESEGETVYTEEIDIRSGGTDREPSRWDRFKMWLRYR